MSGGFSVPLIGNINGHATGKNWRVQIGDEKPR